MLGDRPVAIGRELTKLYEEIWRGPAGEAISHFSQGQIRGEFTLVIAGHEETAQEWDEAAVRAALAEQLAQGVSRKEAAGRVAAQSGWRKREVYGLKEEERPE
jgi:16S rRNA (cytidine1402-2'-O)-methyltransferase